jgi:hypothetical protein
VRGGAEFAGAAGSRVLCDVTLHLISACRQN